MRALERARFNTIHAARARASLHSPAPYTQVCFSMHFFMLLRSVFFESNMHGGTFACTRSDCTSKESALASFRTCLLRTRRTFARERTLARRTGHAALFAAHRAARILLDPSLDRLCG